MTDNRNTILAVILSGLVLIAWQYFYNVPQMEKQRAQTQTQAELAKPTQPASPGATPGSTPPQAGSTPATPATNAPAQAAAIVSRDAAIAATPRIKIDTPRLIGSISLKGARIDDLALVKFRDTVDPTSPRRAVFAVEYREPVLCGVRLGAGLRLDRAHPRSDHDVGAGRFGRIVADQSGDAEIRQWRRPHLPPHHHDRRPLSLHHQG
jgi:membrane protein insertase, YidC/Oxa1 family, N-terminal domain